MKIIDIQKKKPYQKTRGKAMINVIFIHVPAFQHFKIFTDALGMS